MSQNNRNPLAQTMALGRFLKVPQEIRDMIWKRTLPTHDEVEPEICFLDESNSEYVMSEGNGGEARLKLTVYTAFPVLMHVCHKTRAFVQHSMISGIQFRPGPNGDNLQVPFRQFRPEIDTLYCISPLSLIFSSRTENHHIMKNVRSLAVPQEVYDLHRNLLVLSILEVFLNLENFRVVWVEYPFRMSDGTSRPRWCNLRPVNREGEMHSSEIDQNLTDWRDEVGEALSHVAMTSVQTDSIVCKAWNTATNTFEGLEFTQHTLVQYEGGKWGPVIVPDPEEQRVFLY